MAAWCYGYGYGGLVLWQHNWNREYVGSRWLPAPKGRADADEAPRYPRLQLCVWLLGEGTAVAPGYPRLQLRGLGLSVKASKLEP